jgi:hypothetical protein
MRRLRDALEQSEKDGVAIGHFNVADWVLLKAVLASGQELKVPVVVGASEGEREFFGLRQIAALVRSLREECDCPIFLNADHTHCRPGRKSRPKAGWSRITGSTPTCSEVTILDKMMTFPLLLNCENPALDGTLARGSAWSMEADKGARRPFLTQRWSGGRRVGPVDRRPRCVLF